MKLNKIMKRIVSGTLSVAMVATFLPNLFVFADDNNDTFTYETDSYRVTYNLTNHWENQYQGNIQITNKGKTIIHDWSLAFVSDVKISQIWNANIEVYDTVNVVHNSNYNQDILPGETVSFGFTETADEKIIPEKYELISAPTILDNTNYSGSFSIINDWGSGYSASITITNISDITIEDWFVEFDWDTPIDNFWNAKFIEKNGFHYKLANASYNQNIEPGQSVTIGLQSNSMGNVLTQPCNLYIQEYGTARKNALDTLLNVKDITIDTSSYTLDDKKNYIINDAINSINGTIRSGLIAENANYYIENAWGNVLSSGEFEPNSNWSIENIGLVLGMNRITVNVNFNDGTTATDVQWLCNYNEDNMHNISIDENDPDCDGLINYIEEIYGTNHELADTDGDDLTDYQELLETSTNPLVIDSNNDGILDGRDDYDKDFIDTITEYKLGTDPLCIDTDGDDLTDGDEINKYHTDPLLNDTDSDTVNDKWELDNGYDPLVSDKFFKTSTIVNGEDSAAEITVSTSDGTIATLRANIVNDSPFLNPGLPGYMGNAYDFGMDGQFISAKLKITFNEEYLQSFDSLNPVIYYYNEETQLFEEIETEWDGISNYVIANLSHFSTYILLNKTTFDKIFEQDIKQDQVEETTPFEFVFAIDCSGSMGSQGANNDPNNIRLEVAKEFIDKFNKEDNGAIISFGEDATILCEFTNDKEILKNAVNQVGNTDYATKIGAAIDTSLNLFSDPNKTKRYIVLLTDGISTDSLPANYVQVAKNKQVQIITIGLGNGVNQSYLQEIANYTSLEVNKGLYYFASTASGLISTFDDIEKDVKREDSNKDSNNDGITDAQTKSFCNGTLMTSNGTNPFLGYTYEQIQENDDFDGDGLKNGEEVLLDKYAKRSSEVRLISYPIYADFDCDGMDDAEEQKNYTNPLVPDFYKSDIEWITNNDIYMSSLVSNDYLTNNWAKFQLFAGNAIFGWGNIDYVDDYTVALSNYFAVACQAQMEMDALQVIKSSVAADAYTSIKDNLTYISTVTAIAGDAANTAEFIKSTNDLALCGAKLASLEALIRSTDSLIEAEGLLDKYLVAKTTAIANSWSVETEFSRIYDINTATKVHKMTGNLCGKLSKFTSKLPSEYWNRINNGLTYIYCATVAIDTALTCKKDISALSTIYSSELQYDKAIELTDIIIDNSDNKELIRAARNIKNGLNDDHTAFVNNSKIIIGDIANGTSKIAGALNISKGGPYAWAIYMGICLGDTLWHISTIDQQLLETIALGDTSVCFSKYLWNNIYNDYGNYCHIDNNNFYLMSVLCQLRVVSENSFNSTAQSYSWLYDKLTGIKGAAEDTCRGNIGIVKNVADTYSKILVCKIDYDNIYVRE